MLPLPSSKHRATDGYSSPCALFGGRGPMKELEGPLRSVRVERFKNQERCVNPFKEGMSPRFLRDPSGHNQHATFAAPPVESLTEN